MSEEINVYIKVNEEGTIPTYGSVHAAGCDLYASMDLVIRPGEVRIMPLNFSIAIPDNCEAQIRPRSGLSLKTNIRIPNSPGTIDADYRDMVGVIVENSYNNANLKYEILRNPEIINELKENYVETNLSKYLNRGEELKILNDIIYLDKRGNPYGTIYIKKNERIAQMVFCEYKKAKFIEHDNPVEIGENRGGGFGHTGV
ncbi:dUTP diphosphatase [Clostridium sp. YIM B02551]|uniref:dUTP diphosphatase n=1 Tax=Clostridium sp. YIM B02551 TaxID=2910679 RepID=UPI001EEBFAA8|nr:aminotransferase [Clostridium sp. YIM B02551]